MKTAYSWYLVAAIVIVAIILAVFQKGQSFSGSMTASTTPVVVTTTVTTTTVTTPVKPTTPKTTTSSGGLLMLSLSNPILPTYYSQQIASTTLEVHVSNPITNTTVASPLTVTGEARGSWFFEGSFPITLTDSVGHILVQSHVTATSNWQTNDFVPFSASLSFAKQKSGSVGYLILRKDNPSGLAKNDAAVEISVTF